MKGRILVIASPGVAAGFRLAGVDVEEAASAAQGASRVTWALRLQPALAVVLVEEDLFAALPSELQTRARSTPLLLSFPRPALQGPSPEQEVLELLRRAVGYQVRLQ